MKATNRFLTAWAVLCKKPLNTLLIAVFVAAVWQLLSLYRSADSDDGRWQQFKTEHHCVRHQGGVGATRLSWLCDDGKTYFGWRQQR